MKALSVYGFLAFLFCIDLTDKVDKITKENKQKTEQLQLLQEENEKLNCKLNLILSYEDLTSPKLEKDTQSRCSSPNK